MGADDDVAKPAGAADVRFNWISERTCSSLKIKEDVFQKMLASESRYVSMCTLDLILRSPCCIFKPGVIRFGLTVMLNLVANRRGQITSFLDDPEVPRLMIYMDGKDLAAVSHVRE